MTTAPTRRRLIARRIALVALVGLVAVVFLSSSLMLISVVIAMATISAVIIDSIAMARLDGAEPVGPDAPHTITVDLSRRS